MADRGLTGDPNQQPVSQFAESLRGQCLCGSISVTIKDSELFTRRRGHICHCSNCRKVSGSYASINLIIEDDKVDIVDRDGTLTEFKDGETLSGNTLGRWFCSRCGNPIKSVNSALEGKVILKMGIFPRIPAPEMEAFTLHRHPWQGNNPDVIRYKTKLYGETI
ncbi:unnamed protein product [Clonostachys chloroleuca]|uniref:CENP-V/GFA domain-containing protein n=1 Tax=Clonostachys chloroleuca TaxID=1926264 RepID=A0AA35QBR7_9HYPO|nr:unnamed protein product [Clonostachys chloroleuca]